MTSYILTHSSSIYNTHDPPSPNIKATEIASHSSHFILILFSYLNATRAKNEIRFNRDSLCHILYTIIWGAGGLMLNELIIHYLHCICVWYFLTHFMRFSHVLVTFEYTNCVMCTQYSIIVYPLL